MAFLSVWIEECFEHSKTGIVWDVQFTRDLYSMEIPDLVSLLLDSYGSSLLSSNPDLIIRWCWSKHGVFYVKSLFEVIAGSGAWIACTNKDGVELSCSNNDSIFCVAIADRGTSEDGFHRVTSPHTAAMTAFQDHTATGKLKAVAIPTIPRG